MGQDTLRYDSLENRPLPKWLKDQKDGHNTVQPARITMKEDRSLGISFLLTCAFIIIVVAFLTVYILRKNKNRAI